MNKNLPDFCFVEGLNIAKIPDPFSEGTFLNLEASLELASGLNFNLVDGTVAFVTSPTEPFILFKGYNPGTWFYAPRWGRLATREDGTPAFQITKKVKNNPDGSRTTLGGVLSFMIELVVQLPDASALSRWTDLIRTLQPGIPILAGGINFQPLRLTDGCMNVYGLSDFVASNSQPITNVEVGASSSIGFAIQLNPKGADYLYALVGNQTPLAPQIAILIDFKYDTFIPSCQIKAKGYKKKTYDYFSQDLKARGSYFGLWNGRAEMQTVRAELKQIEGLDVEIIGEPPSGVSLEKLLDSIFDRFVKLEVGKWIQPDPKPIDAPRPGGFFGGVSYLMKSVDLSDTAQFDQILTFSKIEQEIFQVSFNFEQQLKILDASKHAFLVEDDVQLPYKVTFSASTLVNQYNVAATYTTSGTPRTIQFSPPIEAKTGGARQGIIQFVRNSKPDSAQMSATIDFAPPNRGYEIKKVEPISDTGASFYFHPDVFCQKTVIYFVFALVSTNPADRALFRWMWNPSNGNRPPLGGAILVAPPPPDNLYNIPSTNIEFPFHPDDWKPDGTSNKIQFIVKGLAGDWKEFEPVNGEIQLFEPAIDIDWKRNSFNYRSLSETLTVPKILYERYSQGYFFLS